MKIKSVVVSILLLFPLAASAHTSEREGRNYLRYDFVNLSVDDSFYTANPNAFQFSLGIPLTQHLSIEASALVGVNEDGFGYGYTTKLNSMYGGFIRGSLPLGYNNIYGRVGMVGIEIEVNETGFGGETYDDTGMAFGVGLEMPITTNSALMFEYTNYPNINVNQDIDIETSGVSIGVKADF